MNRLSGVPEGEEHPGWKIELYNPDGSVKQTILDNGKPFADVVQAKKKLREMGEPFGARIKHIDG